jgi:hypothetical protein
MKAIQSLEIGVDAPDGSGPAKTEWMDAPATWKTLPAPPPQRLFAVYRALRSGMPLEDCPRHRHGPWFLAQMSNRRVRWKRTARAYT